jgi:histidinol dehydrogenase
MMPPGGAPKTGTIGPVENHRGREEGVLVYPVYSRRSKGLSVGINLFPDRKVCLFDCPYCEVFPFRAAAAFSPGRMETELLRTIREAEERSVPVRDLCFSGSGEPAMSPAFPAALESAARIRDALVPEAALVLITNGTGLLGADLFEFLRHAAAVWALQIWLKLDAGTEEWYRLVNRGAVPFGALTGAIRDFVRRAPVIIQTMVCSINGRPPPDSEAAAWERLALELAGAGMAAALTVPVPAAFPPAALPAAVPAANAPIPGKDAAGSRIAPGVRGFQIYGKARPAPGDPLAEALPPAFLESRAASLRAALAAAGIRTPGGTEIPVEVFP